MNVSLFERLLKVNAPSYIEESSVYSADKWQDKMKRNGTRAE